MTAVRAGVAAAFLAALALVAGCGGEQSGEVSGTVTYDGKPVEDGAIAFAAVDGKSPTGGGVIKEGKYTATKVPVGPCKVSITASKVVKERKAYDDASSPMISVSVDVVPAKYNKATELQFDVKPGPQTKDFDLPK